MTFRRNLLDVLSPSLQAVIPNWVEPMYFKALGRLESYARHSRGREPLPSMCPYTWADVMGRADGDWIPTSELVSD